MADDKNKTETGNVPKMTDTKTRKTLKLKPVKQKSEKEVLDPVIDPLTMRNTETGPLGTMDDTRTRKTVKLKATRKGITIEDTPKVELKPVVDPLTARNTETGPLGAMVDTRTRKTVKLKPLKSTGDIKSSATSAVDNAAPETPAGTLKDTSTRRTLKLKAVNPADKDKAPETPAGTLKDTSTRRTLKLKAVNPADKAPETPAGGAPGMLKDTQTRKTLKLKPVKAEDETPDAAQAASEQTQALTKAPAPEKIPMPPPAAVADEAASEQTQAFAKVPAPEKVPAPAPEKVPAPAPADETDDDTRTRNVKIPSTQTAALSTKDLPEKESGSEDDTIKIERPKQKADAMAMPSLGVTAEAKTVNNKETVKLRPPSTGKVKAGDEAAKASKETIKLSPLSTPEAKDDEVAENAPTVNLKLDEKKAKKSKLTIGKAPPPKTQPKEEATPDEKGGGLKLKSMAPKTEAPRAAADKEKIKEKKRGKKGNSQASPVYAAVAIITFILVAFSALATTAQFLDLWEPENPVGKEIVPHVKSIMDNLMKSLIK